MTSPGGPVLVIGGAGRTGRRVAERLQARGLAVRSLSRHGGRPADSGVEHVVGDLTRLSPDVLDDVTGIVVSVEPPYDAAGAQALMHHGVAAVAAAAADRSLRVVLVSQIYITRPDAYPQMSDVVVARARGEEALRDSGAQYVIVRPGWLTDGVAGAVRLEQGDTGDGEVSRDSVAEACVQALLIPAAARRTFELFDGEPVARPVDWPRLLGDLAPDPSRDR